jgi:hypothetical protein
VVTGSVPISQAELFRLLRRLGYPAKAIEEIAAQLADPIHFERDSHILERYGVTLNKLMDRLGASP